MPELREAHMKGPERCAYPLLALLCTSGRGGAYRFKPKRDPGIHSGRGGATAGGSALYSRLL